MKVLPVLASILLAVATPATANAEDFLKIFALQMRLKQEGFYTGKIDGRFGAGSRAAMSAYAAKNNLPNKETEIIDHMAITAMRSRIEPTEGMREVAIAKVKEQLKDPFSAEISVDYAQMQQGGAAVCGQVNAKNSYGAYTGNQAFQVTLTPSLLSSPPFFGIAQLEETGAAWLCLLGTSTLSMVR